MKSQSSASPLFVGLALFSMFFGSGNLIFPLFLGQMAQENWLIAFAGFSLTAVAVPFLGVVAMLLYNGSLHDFFKPFGRRLAWLFSAVLLTVWIPLGSGPRCIALSYATLTSYLDTSNAWLFSLLYSLLVWGIVCNRDKILTVLGYWLTPLLLGCLALIALWGWSGHGFHVSSIDKSSEIFSRGMLEGYNTMDLIAAFFFSATVIGMLRIPGRQEKQVWVLFLQASLVASAILAIVYFGLVRLAAVHSDILMNVPKEQMLAELAKAVMGSSLSSIAGAAIFLACLTTSVALTVVYADFLAETFGGSRLAKNAALFITLVICGVMSLIGLSGITAITAPLLELFYPALILMILFRVGAEAVKSWKAQQLQEAA